MKKVISLLISFIIVCGVVPFAFGEGLVIDGNSFCDFYSASGETLSGGVREKSVFFKSGDSAKYDLSALGLAEGSYSVSLCQANTLENLANKKDIASLKISVDGKIALVKELSSTASNTSFEEIFLGNIYISEGSDYLEIKNTSLHERAIVDIEKIILSPASDNAVVKGEFAGINTLSLNANEGYFDVAGADFWSNSYTPMGVSAGSVMLHGTGDWAAYDIEGFSSGVYNIKISTGERLKPKLSLYIDDDVKFQNINVNLSGAYGSYSDTDLGDIYIPSSAKVLKIENTAQATEIRRIILTKVSDGMPVLAKDYDDFYDNQNQAAETDDAGVVLRNSEWIKFNIGKIGLGSGNYQIAVTFKNQTSGKSVPFLDIYKDDELEVKKSLNSGDLSGASLGIIHVTEETEFITLKNSSVNENTEVLIEKIVFTEIGEIQNKEYVFGALNICSEPDGYFDTQGADFWENITVDGSQVTAMTTGAGAAILHSGDWVEYDISGISSGTYDFKIKSSERLKPVVEVSIDAKTYFGGVALNIGGGYGDSFETDTDLGRIYINSGAKKLRIKNTLNATYLKSFTLTKISDMMMDEKTYELGMANVLSKTEGEGYHDEDGKEFSDYEFSESGATRLHKGDYVCFDVSKVPSGYYVAYAMVKDSGMLKAYVDENVFAENKEVKNESEYRDFEKVRLSGVYIDSDTESIKIQNTSENDLSVLLKEICLETAMVTKSLSYTSDEEGENKISSICEADAVYLSGVIERYKDENEEVVITTALYCDGALKEVIKATKMQGETVSEKILTKGCDQIKTFVWDENLMPLSENLALYEGIEIHVYVSAQSGSDENGNGTEKSPYKTIECAKEKVRMLSQNMKGDIVVHLSGEFIIDEPVLFTSEDSGKNGFDIIYDGNGSAKIYGGRKVTGWQKVSGTEIYTAKIEGVENFRQFYINENRGERAKSKYLYWASDIYNDGIDNYVNNTIDGFILSADDFGGEFSRPADLEFVWTPSWKNIKMPVENITKNENGDLVVKFKQPYFDSSLLNDGDGMPKPSKDTPFYIENAVEFLDEPGEWYYNKDTKMLYYYPTENENMETAECFIPISDKLISISGSENKKAENITFKNITFSYGAWEEPTEKGFITHQAESLICADSSNLNPTSYDSKIMPAQIEVEMADNINFCENEFSHLGSVAVKFSNKTTNSKIEGNIFDDISATAVVLGDDNLVKNTPKEDMCSNLKVSNNLIRRTSVEYGTPIITAYYLRESSIRDNDIKDAPYTGISLGWGWGNNVDNSAYNDVSGNRIENVMAKLHDGGHIYTLGKQTGTVISKNYLIKSEDYHGGVYLDNSSAEITVRDNVFKDCPKWVRMLYYNVKDNVGRNNYSNTIGSIDDKNDFEEATTTQNDIWCDEALDIMNSAGLKGEYSSLLTVYEEKSDDYRNEALKWLKYDDSPGLSVPAGSYMEGGLGVAYNDISTVPGGLSAPYEPGLVAVGSGVNHKYITMTGQGEWTKYKVDIKKTAEYEFFLTFVSLGYQYVNIYIDDVLVVNKKLLEKSADDYNDVMHTLKEQKLATINLTEGEHTVKIEHAVSNFVPYKFRIAETGAVYSGRNDGFCEDILNAINYDLV